MIVVDETPASIPLDGKTLLPFEPITVVDPLTATGRLVIIPASTDPHLPTALSVHDTCDAPPQHD
jgi:hypothetical protein